MSISAFTSYLEFERNYSKHTITAYKKDLMDFSGFILEEFDEPTIDHIGYNLIRSWIVHLVDQGITTRSVNRKVSSLRAYYRFLQKTEQITASPLVKHKALKTQKKLEVPFSEIEMSKIIQDIPFSEDFEGMRDKLIIELLYTTGMRRSELVNLKRNDIAADYKTIKVLGKRNKERIIPLLPTLKSFIEHYLEHRNALKSIQAPAFLFLTKSGSKIYETLVYRIINKYFSLVSPKVKKSPHILRHTFATHMLNRGADLNSVKELLGHSSLASTQVYTHNSIAELKKVHLKAHPRNKKD